MNPKIFLQISQILQLVTNRRLLVTFFMGFSSGLPIALCTSTLQAWYTVAGISIVAIGFLTLTGQPYVYKFLWAPLLDRFVPPFLGRRRGWILLMQFALAITIATMAVMNPKTTPGLLAGVALFAAFLSATQDIGIDAYRVDLLRPAERGFGAAMVTGGYRLALLVSGGLAMVIAAEVGWRITYLCMAGLMLLGIFITLWSPEAETPTKPPVTLAAAVFEPFKEFISRRSALLILIFIVIYKLSDALAMALGTTFLIRGVGFSLAEVGAIYKVVGIVATIAGAFVGGTIMSRWSLYRSLFCFGLLQGVSNLSFMFLALIGKNYLLMVSAVFIENFCGGLSTVALVAFLMSLCDIRYSATQFALLSALSAIGRVFTGPIAAVMVQHLGWAQFYLWTFILSLPSFMLLWGIRNKIPTSAPTPMIADPVD